MTVNELITKLQKLDEANKNKIVLLIGDYNECKKVDDDEEYNVVVLSE